MDEELIIFFENDLKVDKEKNPKIKPIPNSEPSLMFTQIAGKRRDVQIFFDNGCNCAILREGVPHTEFKSTMLKKGPIELDVPSGLQVKATCEWANMLPLADGSYQVIRCLSFDRVTSDMPIMRMRGLMDEIKEEYKDNLLSSRISKYQMCSVEE